MRSLPISIFACLSTALAVVATPLRPRGPRPVDSACPPLTSLTLVNGNPTNPASPKHVGPFENLEYLGEGADNCAYTNGQVVAKLSLPTLRANGRQRHIAALKKMTEIDGNPRLFNHGSDSEGREWVVEVFERGKYFYQTKKWLEVVKGEFLPFFVQFKAQTTHALQPIEQCERLLKQDLYQKIQETIARYIRVYGMFYDDINPFNFLFSDDWNEVTIIDWATWAEKDRRNADSMGNYVNSKLEERFPAYDEVALPGFCLSKYASKVFWPYPDQRSTYKQLMTAFNGGPVQQTLL